MRARDMIDALDRVSLFRAQALNSHRRLDDIGSDLDGAISLLDLQLQQSPDNEAGAATGVTQGIHRAVLDWSTGIIAKLAGAIPPRSETKTGSLAAVAPGGTGKSNINDRHARNSRRWLLDPRIWEAFVRSLEGAAVATEPTTHVPLAAGVPVLRAAVLAVREAESGGRVDQGKAENEDDDGSAMEAVASAGDWAFIAIRKLCGGDDSAGKGLPIVKGAAPGALSSHTVGVGEGRGGVLDLDETGVGEGGSWKRGRPRGRGALMRVTLDACTIFVEEVIRGRRGCTTVDLGGYRGGRAADEATTSTDATRSEEVLTELLRFLGVLIVQQTNRRKVFASFCSKLMGPLFEMLSETRSVPLKAAVTALAWDALFHEEHLEGYREAFIATAAAGEVKGGDKAKRRRTKKNSSRDGDGRHVPSASGATAGGGRSSQRRACYQQQLLEEISKLASSGEKRSRLGAAVGAPLLLEGFIVGLKGARRESADIHMPSGGGSANASAVVVGGKRSRSAASAIQLGGAASMPASPASQMFKLWAVLTSILGGGTPIPPVEEEQNLATLSALSHEQEDKDRPSHSHRPTPSLPATFPVRGCCNHYLRACNEMLRLLVAHDVYRVNEDRGGLELDRLRAFSTKIIDLADAQPREPGADGNASPGTTQGFVVRIFRSLLTLNHGILHDDLSRVLRMTLEWGFTAAEADAAQESEKAGIRAGTAAVVPESIDDARILHGVGSSSCRRSTSGGSCDSGVKEEEEGEYLNLGALRALCVDLVIGVVDTYSRLRQVDHLVRALFGAVDARPSAAAAMLRGGGSVEDALGRAFRQLPEGQIESMWCVLADHLRESWKRLQHNNADAGAADADATSSTSPKAEATVGAPATGYPLAREIDAELFVLFVRNLHVTSSVASVVGELCENLAEESLRCFEGSIQESRATVAAQGGAVAPSSPSPKKAKKKKRQPHQQEEEEREKAQQQHGRSGLSLATPLPFRPALEVHGWLLDLDTRCRFWSQILGSSSAGTLALPAENTPSVTSPSPSATLPRMITAAAAAAASAAHGDHSRATTATMRLKKTLQQVAVHRVQQIYARLNGAAALEANSGGRRGGGDQGEEQDGRLEKEARELVDFAFAMVASDRPRGCPLASVDTQANTAAACDGDREDDREGPSLSAMMPYLPVWVGFAAVEQVSTFVETIFLRCATDLLAGRREYESAPLRLLTDASFYEMEAIAETAPSVLLRVVRDAVDLAVTFADGVNKGTGSEAARQVIQALASQQSKRQRHASKPGGGGNDDGKPPESRGNSGIIMSSSSSSSNRGGKDNGGDGGGGETAVCDQLRKATCLLLLAEQFPPGFLEDDAVDGLLTTADALGSTCVRALSSLRLRRPCSARIEKDKDGRGIENEEDATDAASALSETVAALRGLLLHLLLLRPESSVMSPGDLLLRAIDSAVETITANDGVQAALVVPLQLRSSTALLPLLAERCATEGRTEAVLETIARLGVARDGKFTWGHDGGRRRPQPPLLNPTPKPCCWCGKDGESDEEGERTLFLFHGVLSGFVAGETRRLAAADTTAASTAAARAAEIKASLDAEPNAGGEDVGDNVLTLGAPPDAAMAELKSQPSATRLNRERLFAPVSRLAGCLPAEQVAPAPRRGLAAGAAAPRSSTPLLSSSHLFVLGDALRLSFLGAESERLVFPSKVSGSLARTRSRWVQDAALYLRRRAEAAVAAGENARGGRRRNIETRVGVFYVSGSGPGDDGNVGDNNRDEVGTCTCACDTLSERSACCQLLRVVCGCSQLLDPPLPRSAIRDITEAFLMFIVADRGGVGGGRQDREKDSNKQEISLLLEAAFCLLVQRASEEQLDEVFVTLLEALGVEEEEGGGRLRTSATCRACAAVVAVTLVRLAAQAGGGENFRAVASNRATSLIASLCRSLRRAAVVTDPSGGTGHNSRREANCACTRTDEKLKSAAEALDGLESLMSRGRGASATARVVSVVLGSMEPAVRAVLDTAEALRFGRGKEGSQSLRVEIARCFRACCGVLGTLLQVHARKIFSCTPPFAALCRSLLRLFFCLAAPEPRATAGAHPTSTLLPLGEQLSAASALARVLEQFLPNGDVLRRYAAVVLLEYVSLAGSSALEPAPRAALLAGVFAVMEACTRREMRQLHGLLTASSPIGQEVFRSLNEEYQRRHKYTGNI